jgi:hypothetical protein
MKLITITNNITSLVDDEDFEKLSGFRWYLHSPKHKYPVRFYAGSVIYMHREITDCPIGLCVDHIDGDKLNNRKSNLRICSHKENIRNQKKWSKPTSSQFKGVSFHKRKGMWAVAIRVDGKRLNLGYFTNEVVAASAYNQAAIKYHGEYAGLNDLTKNFEVRSCSGLTP